MIVEFINALLRFVILIFVTNSNNCYHLTKFSLKNEAATISVDTEIMLHNVAPFPPYNLTANSTDSEITLHWQPGRKCKYFKQFKQFFLKFILGYMRPNLEYIVWYRPTNTAEWRTLKAFTRNNIQMATVRNLKSGNEYEFMVLCQDQYGEGMFSKSFRYFTKSKNVIFI